MKSRVLVCLCLVVLSRLISGCGRPTGATVVVYCAQDQVFAEPLLGEFGSGAGIKPLTVFDSEAVKTVGLANRLLAEKANPQCDLFWANEELRVRQLAAQGVFRPTKGFVTFGYRSRRIVINTNQVSLADAPRSLQDLTNASWRGKIALAYPLFGTTATHFLALRQHWGDASWQAWCRALQANKPLLLDGNSVVVKMVGQGEAWIGLTDSDDITGGIRERMPIAALPLTPEMLLIPNAVGVVQGAPHPIAAERLMTFLQRPEVLERLVRDGALEGAQASPSTGLGVNWDALLKDLDASTTTLKEIFLR